jgi:threonine synthase
MTTLTHLECSLCGKSREAGKAHGRCGCGGILLVRYDLESARQGWSREWLAHAPPTMWRYAPLLPAADPGAIVSLGEGMTPLVRARRFGQGLGMANLWIKDDGANPTGSSEARSFSCAISMAVELNLRQVAASLDGPGGAALAAYAAAAGIAARISLPEDAPQAAFVAGAACGAEVVLGGAWPALDGWFDLGAFAEPYRVEGLKTLGYEIAEQLRWEVPDAVLCPVGDGAGLIGIWKACGELEALGWIGSKRPKMIAVQAEGCRPIVDAFESGSDLCTEWPGAHTIAAGIRVPKPAGGRLVLKIVRASGGGAAAVSDWEMLDAGIELAGAEGIFPAPEGAACMAALRKVLAAGLVRSEETVVILNTAAGQTYAEAYSTRFPRVTAGEQDRLGGLITPR